MVAAEAGLLDTTFVPVVGRSYRMSLVYYRKCYNEIHEVIIPQSLDSM